MISPSDGNSSLFLQYWQSVASQYYQHGDYAWMLQQLGPAQRIIEIGCGLGYSSLAIVKDQRQLLSIDNNQEMIDCARALLAKEMPETLNNSSAVQFVHADIAHLGDEQLAIIEQFQADALVCWLIGDSQYPSSATNSPPNPEIRYLLQQQILQFFLQLNSLKKLQLVDRSVIPWQAKDISRKVVYETTVAKVIKDLPAKIDQGQIVLRKMDSKPSNQGEILLFRRQYPKANNIAAVFISSIIERS